MIRIQTIDTHSGGDPLRLIVGGFPAPKGKSMAEKREWAARHADHLRRVLMLEPRGHADMRGALLTEPAVPGSHAGILFIDAEGYSSMSGHGIIAATTAALERGLINPGGDGTTVVYDTPAGTVRARARVNTGEAGGAGQDGGAGTAGGTRVNSVAFVNVPAFVLYGGIAVRLGTRVFRADIAFGGAFYAIVDSEATGLGIDSPHVPELRRTALDITRAIESTHQVVHPLDSRLNGVYGVVFTGPSADGRADIRSAMVSAGGQLARSPSGTGTSAVMAVLDAMGLLVEDAPFVHESLIGSRFTGRIRGRSSVGDCPAIVPEVEGSAWITGEHVFLVDESDPLREGFRV